MTYGKALKNHALQSSYNSLLLANPLPFFPSWESIICFPLLHPALVFSYFPHCTPPPQSTRALGCTQLRLTVKIIQIPFYLFFPVKCSVTDQNQSVNWLNLLWLDTTQRPQSITSLCLGVRFIPADCHTKTSNFNQWHWWRGSGCTVSKPASDVRPYYCSGYLPTWQQHKTKL